MSERPPLGGDSDSPCSNNSLNACLELDDAYLRVLVERDYRHAQRVREPGEAVGLVLIVECVQYLDYRHSMIRRGASLRVDVLASH